MSKVQTKVVGVSCVSRGTRGIPWVGFCLEGQGGGLLWTEEVGLECGAQMRSSARPEHGVQQTEKWGVN